jgi:hypothetical protein
MNLSLNLSPDLLARLRDRAAQEGVQPEVVAANLLEDQLADKPPSAMSESELLLEASRGLPEPLWTRYHELSDRQQAEGALDADDHREFVELNEVVETTHARRMKYVTELALRRGTALRDLMDELGFPNYGAA